MSDEIKPRVDEHGVGWCHEDCPEASDVVYDAQYDRHVAHCEIDHSERMCGCDVCPHHARRVAECLRLTDAVLAQIGQRMNNGGAFAVGLDANGAQFMTLVERNRREVIIKARALLDTRGEEVG